MVLYVNFLFIFELFKFFVFWNTNSSNISNKSIVDLSILVERLCISDAFDTENQAEEKMLLQKLLEKRLEETHGFIAYTQQLYYVINLICEEDNEYLIGYL